MDLTPGQQRLLFVVVVLALVGLGIFLVSSHKSASGSPAGTPAAAPSQGGSSGTGTGQPGGAATYTPPATLPAATPVSTVGGADIYQWLPFTPAELTAAARTTLDFARNYVTWSYKETKAAYAARLSGLVTAKELATIMSGYSTNGLSSLRGADKQVSAGSGTIDSISSFGVPLSITFAVTINQQVTSTQPAKTTSSHYDITVEQSGSGWQVYDFELFGLGNQ
jgi:hypothetical protein